MASACPDADKVEETGVLREPRPRLGLHDLVSYIDMIFSTTTKSWMLIKHVAKSKPYFDLVLVTCKGGVILWGWRTSKGLFATTSASEVGIVYWWLLELPDYSFHDDLSVLWTWRVWLLDWQARMFVMTTHESVNIEQNFVNKTLM